MSTRARLDSLPLRRGKESDLHCVRLWRLLVACVAAAMEVPPSLAHILGCSLPEEPSEQHVEGGTADTVAQCEALVHARTAALQQGDWLDATAAAQDAILMLSEVCQLFFFAGRRCSD